MRPGRPDSRGYVSFLTGDQQFYPGFYSEDENRQKPKKKKQTKKQKHDVLTSLLQKHLMGGKDFNPNQKCEQN